MIPVEFYFDKNWPHPAGKYLVVEEPAKKILSSKWKVVCTDCGKITLSKAGDLYRGQRPCACGIKYYNTHERKMEKLETLFKDRGFSLVDPETKILTSHQKIEVFCSACEKCWSTSFDSLINSGNGCYNCSNQNRSLDDYELLIKKALQNSGLHFKTFIDQHSRVSFKSKAELSCENCFHCFFRTVGKILKAKNGCPACVKYGFKESETAVLYLLKVEDIETKNVFYKYGIANNLANRLYQYRSSGRFKIKLISEWFYFSASKCKEDEKFLKSNFKTHAIKSEFPDGYTETIRESEVMDFFNIQTAQYGG